MGQKLVLPRRVHVGLGHVITIRMLTKAQMKDKLEGEDVQDLVGFWLDEDNTIYIHKGLTQKQKREVYWHELQHAIMDIGLRDKGGVV